MVCFSHKGKDIIDSSRPYSPNNSLYTNRSLLNSKLINTHLWGFLAIYNIVLYRVVLADHSLTQIERTKCILLHINGIQVLSLRIINVLHYNDRIMTATATQITSVSIVCSTIGSDADQRKRQSSASLAFVRGIHRWPVNSPHKRPVTRKMFPFDDVIIIWLCHHKSSGRRIDGLVQDCSNSSALAMELLQSCTKPSYILRRIDHGFR